MTVRSIVVSKLAEREIDAADLWWRLHRPAAAATVRHELARVVGLLVEQPYLGILVPGRREIRRYLLPAISSWLYYRATASELRVLRLWHTSRRAPDLSARR